VKNALLCTQCKHYTLYFFVGQYEKTITSILSQYNHIL